uniref:Sulfotransferase n=1 Tax=Rhipicephalus zambeziensis TaxID=60191 RepID=A0A224Z7D2_9ACAR
MASPPDQLQENTGKGTATAQACKSGSQALYRDVGGVYLNIMYPEQNVLSALSYKPLDGDLFVASYPKCGTTWTQHIVYSILRDGATPTNIMEFMSSSPFLEFMGAEGARAMPRPGAIKTHLPFNKVPYSAQAKYIYITRNPYDCCVSAYYHVKNFHSMLFDGTFDEYFDMFVEGKVDYGDYFAHLLSWYKRRGDSNVLFLTYEELKKDSRGCVLKMADFIDKQQYGDKLRNQPELLNKVLDSISKDSMRKLYSQLGEWGKQLANTPVEALPEAMRSAMETIKQVCAQPIKGDFVRKGIVGDWKNHFSSEQIARMKELIAARTAGSDVMDLWKDTDIPR